MQEIQEMCIPSPGWEDLLEQEMATQIPWTEKYGGPQSMEPQRVICDWAYNMAYAWLYTTGVGTSD